MTELGNFALILGLFLSSYAVFVDLLGSWRNKSQLTKSASNATIATLICLTVAIGILWIVLIRSDFHVRYVVEHTAKSLPVVYKISALWAGASGSLLLWLWLQVGFVVLVFYRCRSSQRRFFAHARSAANMVSVFFLFVLVFDKNPFGISPVVPSDGAGLNPLLQHPAMVIHPPALFIGYAAFIIPFAWTFAWLKREPSLEPAPIFRQARNWTLVAWLFLTIGIVLGAWWAYEELGWGGYWAWDPVENSSLLPWLTATALIHCYRTYNKNNSIANWLAVLNLGTFSLCIFGTFLTRYGLVSSVHAFPEAGLGILFIILLVFFWVIAGVLMLIKHLRGEKTVAVTAKIYKLVTLNNWLMVLLTFVILVGTLFPFFSGLLSSQKISLKPEYFTKITAPGGLLLLLLLAVCPYLMRYGINRNWRIVAALIIVIIAPAAWLISGKIATAYFIVCGFAGGNLVVDLISGYTKRKIEAEKRTPLRPNLRLLGARIVHFGVVLVFIGIAGSGGYGIEKHVALKPDGSTNVAGYDITFKGFKANHGPNFTAVTADIVVEKDKKLIARLYPSQAVYSSSGKRTSEVDIHRTLAGDLYLALADMDVKSELINLNVLIKPLIDWIWIGSIISMLGAVLVLISYYSQKTTVSREKAGENYE
jgi:cytochrome c-type biogenesis protein CcmF